MISLFVKEILYFTTMTLVNFSMLALYWRTFGAFTSARIVIKVLGLLAAFSCIAGVSLSLVRH